jgi:hypothetical protein
MLCVLPFSKNDRLDFVLYAILIGGYIANVFLPSSWILR